MANRAFWRALHSLAHPVTVWAVVLLLLNDHWFRFQWPSWWTGKLGDWAWLTFAPLICAVVVAWFVPKRLAHQENIVGVVAFAFIGLWFALAKTVPLVHLLTTTALDALVGWQGTLRLDTSDLITLPALLVGWYIWRRSSNQALPISRAWVVLTLGVIGTLATSCPYQPVLGVNQLCQRENKLFASSGHISTDGGITWEKVGQSIPADCFNTNAAPVRRQGDSWLLTSGSQTYRFVPGKAIYSYQAGQGETLEMNLSALGREVREIYYEGRRPLVRICPGPIAYFPGPLDALVDTKTGNLVLAMGLDGILIKTRDNRWHWVTVGQYHYVNLDQELDIIHFLQPELLSAVLLLFLVAPTISLNSEALSCGGHLSLIFGWLSWLIIAPFYNWYSPDTVIFIVPFLVFIIAVFTLTGQWLEIYLFRRKSALATAMIVVLSLTAAGLYFLPYMAWARGTVPDRGTATIFAVILGVATIFSAGQYMRVRFPLGKKKRHDEDWDDAEAADEDEIEV